MRPIFSGCRFIAKELPLNAVERTRLAAEARRRWLGHGRNGLWMFLAFVLLLVVMIGGGAVLRHMKRSHGWPDLNFGFLMIVLLGCMVGFPAWRERRLGRFVYAELRNLGHDVCLRCGYLRIDIDAAAPCPECGTLAATNVV